MDWHTEAHKESPLNKSFTQLKQNLSFPKLVGLFAFALLEDLINLQWNSARVLPNPDLLFHWMDPIVGIQRLLLNPRIRERMKYNPSQLSAEEITAGHFLTGKIAQAAIDLMPRFDVPVRPLFIGWWADATNVSCGGMSLVVINRLQTNLCFFFIIIFFFLC